ncbi:sensor histidine kinase [Enterococcus sp. BWB1-3]|uniref:sensor histidine kinase n=1 Tax=Enterococcus sp. BWB1-3 TaxID=2787713 RepID=UPI0019227F6E|nr:sensor histidine kinase [Enterococcus sp. BWB1-3]MBL1228073.1 sensor histidine kinase [Enterococcus sp. BWB1-3]
MKTKIADFFKKDFLINQLMQLYSILLILVSIFIMLTLSLYTGIEQFHSSWQSVENTGLQLDSYTQEKSRLMTEVLGEFTNSDRQFESVRNYLNLTPAEYFDYTNEIYRTTGENIYIPNTLSRIFNTYGEISELAIRLEESEYYLKADRERPQGTEFQGNQIIMDESLYLIRSIYNPGNLTQVVGQLFIAFDDSMVLGSQSEENRQRGISSFIYSSSGQRLYENNTQMNEQQLTALDEQMQQGRRVPLNFLKKNYYVKAVSSREDRTILILLSKQRIWKEIFAFAGMIFFFGILIIALLLLVLNRTFKRYSSQVRNIVEATKKVSQGNFKEQIDTTEVQQELKEIAEAINQMTVSINDYIEDIYTLEIKQRDAHMRALQSQINPHFLYNTLEYIRMYALSRQQEELADVVYAFSALLRNNTTQEKTTTLQNELDFCEKYVYLYQMRYPDKIAYVVTIEENLKTLKIPKFVIQPLVENYFVHGIDYSRNDNAISIKAFSMKGKIYIQIADNGKGIDNEELSMILERMTDQEVDLQNSIGLKNVHERLRGFYGEKYQIQIDSVPWEGVKISIVLDREVLET